MTLAISIIFTAVFILILVFALPSFRRFFVRAVFGVSALFVGKLAGICGVSVAGCLLSAFLGVPGALTFFVLSGILK